MGALILQGLTGRSSFFGFLNNLVTLTNCLSLKEIGEMACVTIIVGPGSVWILFR